MRYKKTNCPESKIVPNAWIVNKVPSRAALAKHLKWLKQQYGRDAAK